MRIIIDAMGGDNAPVEIVKGTLAAAAKRPDVEMVLVGREEAVRAAMGQQTPANVTVGNAT